MMQAFMFPGQGSQAKGMGGTLFDEFKEVTEKAGEILGYSIKELCLEDPRGELGRTEFTQPALYVVNALSYYKRVADSRPKPDFLVGHSLGEFNALLAAECFDFETGLKLVQKRGELMSRVSNGAMAAIVNATKEEIESILAENGLYNIDLANYNTPSQIVISGLADEVGKAQSLFQQGRMLYYPLNTSGAFHSRFMQGAQEQFRQFLTTFRFADLKIPVIANSTARPYASDAVLDTLASQIASTVRWSESIQYLMTLAGERGDTVMFEEIGHGDVLVRLLQAIQRQAPVAVPHSVRKESELADSVVERACDGAGNTPDNSEVTRKPMSALEKVAAWNSTHPIGTRVTCLIGDYAQLETRTEAMVLFGHRAAVYIKGYNGYFDLDEIVAA